MFTIEDFKPLLGAEEKLLLASAHGERLTLGDGDLPGMASTEVEIRAELIRYLLLGSDVNAPLHAKGIRIRGAKIVGLLDLQGCDCSHDLTLTRCSFDKAPNFLNARMRGLHLSGCSTPGIVADNAIFAGSVYLRQGFHSTAEISMPGVRIAGDLQICDAKIEDAGFISFFGVSIRVEGSVFLGDYPFDDTESELHSDGALIFSSAKIAGDFFCKNCAIAPDSAMSAKPIYLDGETIGELTALSLARAEIGGVLFCKNNQISRGMMNFSGARVRRLNDDATGELATYRIRLDGFEYQDFAQEADTSVKSRLEWLERRPSHVEFSAQPYEQLARILNSIGHRDDAQDVLMRKELLQRSANRQAIRNSGVGTWRLPFLVMSDFFIRYLIGYGYRPMFAVFWGVLLIAILSFVFQKTWDAGDMAPNAAPILISKDWISATQTHPDNPAKFWSAPDQAGKDYETFHAIAYAADLLVPIVNLGQESAWAPSTSRSDWGRQAWWLRWFAKAIGWVITALGAAAVTGVIRRD